MLREYHISLSCTYWVQVFDIWHLIYISNDLSFSSLLLLLKSSILLHSGEKSIWWALQISCHKVSMKYLLYPLPSRCFSYFYISIYFIFWISYSGPVQTGNKEHFRFPKFSYYIHSKTQMCPRLVSASLTTSYHLDFLCISKVWSLFTSWVSGTNSE